ncbi:hypothetical protein CALVIDRAFT_541587 [Calocera viscosa TUFC12733]|uniref:Uncharacterized protein n=1 Tax=Calocera viscosa (strain TUFC12733) TaxID=1330018 RepID=A0A167HIZ3_CALVF|nr:hypothetical protein CALVIDRAFT_541587 [Calocera viscosa TUFC12733]
MCLMPCESPENHSGVLYEDVMIGQGSCVFDETNSAQAYNLDLSLWRRTLQHWAISSGHKTCLLRFDVSSLCTITRFADLSGVGALLLRMSEIRDLIVDDLSLAEVQLLRLTGNELRDSLSDTLDRRLRRSFSPYFPDVSAFCAALRIHHAVVGGSTTLSIMRPGKWCPNDLDIVVSPRYAHGIIVFLLDHGFKEITRTMHKDSLYPQHIEGRIYFDYHCYMNGNKKIDLCVVRHEAVTPANYVMTYHSTAVMNFFDGRAIFCLFPNETFNGTFLRNRFTPTGNANRGITKIQSRGYKDTGAYIQDRYNSGDIGRVTVDKLPRIWFMKATV